MAVAVTRKVVVGFVAASLAIFAVVVAANYLIVFRLYGPPASPGEFGDTFGAAGAFLSAFSIAGVLGALILQTLELSMQSRELRAAQREMDRTAAAQEGQHAATLDLARAQLSTAQLFAVAPLMSVAFERVKERERTWRAARERLLAFRTAHHGRMESYPPARQDEVRAEEQRLSAPAREAREELDAASAELRALERRAGEFIADADRVLAGEVRAQDDRAPGPGARAPR